MYNNGNLKTVKCNINVNYFSTFTTTCTFKAQQYTWEKLYPFLHFDFSHYTETSKKEMSFNAAINGEAECSTMNFLTFCTMDTPHVNKTGRQNKITLLIIFSGYKIGTN